MAQKKIVWTEIAARQRRSILEYWVHRNQSPTYSLKLLAPSNHKAEPLALNPYLFKTAEFRDTRVVSMGHYSLFYKISTESIIITALWDNRQDPKKLFELLMKSIE